MAGGGAPSALQGVRVLDLSDRLSAAYAARLLADFGADVRPSFCLCPFASAFCLCPRAFHCLILLVRREILLASLSESIIFYYSPEGCTEGCTGD